MSEPDALVEPLYYARDGKIWKRPIETKLPDGRGSIIKIGFPVCTMHDVVGAEAAETVAALMNRGQERQHESLEARDAAVAAFRDFHNALRILRSIDMDELVTAQILSTFGEWQRFDADPYLFFIKASDETAAALWGVIQARQPAERRS